MEFYEFSEFGSAASSKAETFVIQHEAGEIPQEKVEPALHCWASQTVAPVPAIADAKHGHAGASWRLG